MVEDFLAEFHAVLSTRVGSTYYAQVLVAAVALVVAWSLSRVLARVGFWIGSGFLHLLGLGVPRGFVDGLVDFVRAVIIALALLYFVDALELPDRGEHTARLVILSVLLLHFFTAGFKITADIIAAEMPHSTRESREWIANVIRVFLVLLAVASVLELWGVNISATIAGLGVLGAGLAFAMQDFLQNLVAGLTTAGERRFRSGDWIEVDGIEGVVHHVDLRSTVVMGFDRVPRHIPNSKLANEVLLNKSRLDNWRVYWTITLVRDATDAEIAEVCETIRAHVVESGDFITDGSKTFLVVPRALSDSGIELMIYAYCYTSEWAKWIEIEGRLLSAVLRAIESAGTSIAYETSTVHLAGDKAKPSQSGVYRLEPSLDTEGE